VLELLARLDSKIDEVRIGTSLIREGFVTRKGLSSLGVKFEMVAEMWMF
jgi:hypothetical protein